MIKQNIHGRKFKKTPNNLFSFFTIIKTYNFTKRSVHNIPQVQVDGADVRNKLLRLEVKLTEILNFKRTHLRTHQVLQEVV